MYALQSPISKCRQRRTRLREFSEIIPGTSSRLSFRLPQLSAPPEPSTDLLSPTHNGSEIEFVLEGYALLRKDPRSNLGWRIVLFYSPLEHADLEPIVRETYENSADLAALLPEDYVKFHLDQAEKEPVVEGEKVENPERPNVKFTTFLGAKGLSARHVFVVGLNNGEFPENAKAPTDAEICQFIVALTRAKSSCSLVSNNRYSQDLRRLIKSPSIFLGMIPKATKRIVKLGIKNGKLVRT
jgi:superfamily I DNA/RNA helicase